MPRLGGVIGVVLALVGGIARADSLDPQPIHVRLPEGASCSDSRDFFFKVRGHTPRVRRAGFEEEAQVFDVKVARRASRFTGSLRILEGAHASAPREVSAATCEEVVDALAFIAALSVDPSAQVRPVPLPPPPPPPPPPETPSWGPFALPPIDVGPVTQAPEAPPESVVSTPPALVSTAVSTPASTPGPAPPPAEAVHASPREAAGRPSKFYVAAGGALTFAGPDQVGSVVGGQVFLEGGSNRPGLVAPAVRLSFTPPASSTILPATTSGAPPYATLTLTRGQIDACPIRLRLASDLAVSPCGGFEAGEVDGKGNNIIPFKHVQRLWVAGLAAARARWGFVSFAFLEAELGLTVPFVREQFIFAPQIPVYQAPPAMVRAAASLGVRFP